MGRFTEMTCIVFLITCLTGISSVPFLINRHASWREPVNPYYVNTGYALAPATSANDSEQQSMSSDADTLSLTDSSVYVHIDRRTNTHTDGSILAAASWRNIPSESLERFNFTTESIWQDFPHPGNLQPVLLKPRYFSNRTEDAQTKLDITCHWRVLSQGWQPLVEAGLRAVSRVRRISAIFPQLCSGNRNKSALL